MANKPSSEPDASNDPAPKVEVGFGMPPIKDQFKPGRTGNPRGRPPKIRALEADKTLPAISEFVFAEAYRKVQVRENDKVIELPALQGVLRALMANAIKGNLKAQLAVAALVETTERKAAEENLRVVEAFGEYRRQWLKIFAQHDAAGKPRPEPVPHPEDIAFNFQTSKIMFNGPSNEEEKTFWDEQLKSKEQMVKLIEDVKVTQKRRGADKITLQSVINKAQLKINEIDRYIPSELQRRIPGFNIHHWRQDNEDIHQRITARRAKEARERAVEADGN